MFDSRKGRSGSLRWPPRQRFTATELGRSALDRYQEAIRDYRQRGPDQREELEQIQREWASGFQLEAADAMVLEEFAGGRLLPREVQASLEDCGISLSDVQGAVDRLFAAGLLVPASRSGSGKSG